ncbi:hypothetical protein PpBr36_00606 [Pyricularia pennisetigena]|uniref:hypothetical protein n=1 Tax=Pyricularia pennisetigena TaxID=1578925 RepID=UPI0011509225|nr:hypothetical protein PpBr36_00606 [Pyricularia pennisetigena]TLS29647.1 hypothetical protein PpBr36_00606 [Pyricularia pennisetigena]
MLRWLRGSAKSAPVPLPGDRVVPMNSLDDNALVHNTTLVVSFVYDAVLDPERLRGSLEDLIKRDGWQKLGARIRYNRVTGRHEWHIPSEFTPARPAVAFSAHQHDVPFSEHPASAQIKRPDPASDRPQLISDPLALGDLSWGGPYRPSGIGDWYADPSEDRPAVALRVHAFAGGTTLVCLQWQHVAMDIMALKELCAAWTAVLAGRADRVPVPFGADSDPFEPLVSGTRPASETHVLEGRQAGLLGLFKWMSGYAYDMLVRKHEWRVLCAPRAFWQPRLEAAVETLRGEASARGEDPTKVFLSEGDILLAWIVRCLVVPRNLKPSTTVVVMFTMNMIKAFQGDLFPPASEDRPYMGNAFSYCNVLLKAGDVTEGRLCDVAVEVRRAIAAQGTRAQHEAYFAMRRRSRLPFPMIFFGDNDMVHLSATNWSKADLFQLDLGPARTGAGGAGEAGAGGGGGADDGAPPCRPWYVQGLSSPISPPDCFTIQGRDGHGNYWLEAPRVTGKWDEFMAFVDKELDSHVIS